MTTPRRRILLLVPFAPRPDHVHGGGRAIGQIVAHMAERHDVAVIHPRRPGEPPADPELCRRLERVEEVPLPDAGPGRDVARRLRSAVAVARGTPRWARAVASDALAARARSIAVTWRPDVVQIEFSAMGQYAASLDGLGVPRLLVDHDPGTAVSPVRWRAPRRARDLADALDARAWPIYERGIARHLDAVVVFTPRDRTDLARLLPSTPVHVVPLAHDVPALRSDPEGRDGSVLFVGSFLHPPNVDAALRLVRDVMPPLRSLHPSAALTIVGEAPPPELVAAASRRDDTMVTGRVADVAPHLAAAAVVVAPLRLGRGMRVKVLEAMAAGKAVVASPLALEGLDVRDGHEVLVAEGADATARAVHALLADRPRRRALADAARAWAEGGRTWDDWHDDYAALYASLAGRP